MTNEQQQETEGTRTSREEQFFGMQSMIDSEAGEGGEEQAAGAETEQEQGEPQAEQQAREEEIDHVSESVKKRINQLTYNWRQTERERDAALKDREEAIRVARHLAGQNQQFQQTIDTGEGVLINRIAEAAEAKVNAAMGKFRKAHEEGDTDALIAAQQEMMTAQAEALEANRYQQQYQARHPQVPPGMMHPGMMHPGMMPPQQPQQPRPSQQVPKPTDRAAEWAEKNKGWFHSDEHPDMTALAYGEHERLIRSGYVPDSDEYFEHIDKKMRKHFPEYFADQGQQGQQSETPSVVAPAQRNAGRGTPRTQVKLNERQQALARQLGLTYKQYAEAVLRQEQGR